MKSRLLPVGAFICASWFAANAAVVEDLPTTIIRPGEDRLEITRIPAPRAF